MVRVSTNNLTDVPRWDLDDKNIFIFLAGWIVLERTVDEQRSSKIESCRVAAWKNLKRCHGQRRDALSNSARKSVKSLEYGNDASHSAPENPPSFVQARIEGRRKEQKQHSRKAKNDNLSGRGMIESEGTDRRQPIRTYTYDTNVTV